MIATGLTEGLAKEITDDTNTLYIVLLLQLTLMLTKS